MKVGTLLERIFKATGIQWLVKKIWGEDCGCEERRIADVRSVRQFF